MGLWFEIGVSVFLIVVLCVMIGYVIAHGPDSGDSIFKIR